MSNMKPGDWTCPQCGDLQFARNSSCRMCSAPKPDPNDPVSFPGASGGSSNASWRGEVVYDGGLPVNSNISRESSEIAKLPKGTEVQIVEEMPNPIDGDGRVRARIQCGPIKGWITVRCSSFEYVLPDEDEDVPGGESGGWQGSGWQGNGWQASGWQGGGWSGGSGKKPNALQQRIDRMNTSKFKGNEIDQQAASSLQAIGEQAASLYLDDLDQKGDAVTHPSNYLKAAMRKIGLDPKNPNPSDLTGTHPKLAQKLQWVARNAGGTKREGDWACPTCGANVFAYKMECFRCGTDRPADVQAGTGLEPIAAGNMADAGTFKSFHKPKADPTLDGHWDVVARLWATYPTRAAYGEDEIRMAIDQKLISVIFLSERVEDGVLGTLATDWVGTTRGGVVRVVRPGNRCYDEVDKWSAVAQLRRPIEDESTAYGKMDEEKEPRQERPY